MFVHDSSKSLKDANAKDFFVDTGFADCLDSLVTTDRVGSAVCADHASCDECNGFFGVVECHDLRSSMRMRACNEMAKGSLVRRRRHPACLFGRCFLSVKAIASSATFAKPKNLKWDSQEWIQSDSGSGRIHPTQAVSG